MDDSDIIALGERLVPGTAFRPAEYRNGWLRAAYTGAVVTRETVAFALRKFTGPGVVEFDTRESGLHFRLYPQETE